MYLSIDKLRNVDRCNNGVPKAKHVPKQSCFSTKLHQIRIKIIGMKQRVRNQLEAFDVLEKCGQYRQSKDELSSHCDYSSFDCLYGLRELFNGELLAL